MVSESRKPLVGSLLFLTIFGGLVTVAIVYVSFFSSNSTAPNNTISSQHTTPEGTVKAKFTKSVKNVMNMNKMMKNRPPTSGTSSPLSAATLEYLREIEKLDQVDSGDAVVNTEASSVDIDEELKSLLKLPESVKETVKSEAEVKPSEQEQQPEPPTSMSIRLPIFQSIASDSEHLKLYKVGNMLSISGAEGRIIYYSESASENIKLPSNISELEGLIKTAQEKNMNIYDLEVECMGKHGSVLLITDLKNDGVDAEEYFKESMKHLAELAMTDKFNMLPINSLETKHFFMFLTIPAAENMPEPVMLTSSNNVDKQRGISRIVNVFRHTGVQGVFFHFHFEAEAVSKNMFESLNSLHQMSQGLNLFFDRAIFDGASCAVYILTPSNANEFPNAQALVKSILEGAWLNPNHAIWKSIPRNGKYAVLLEFDDQFIPDLSRIGVGNDTIPPIQVNKTSTGTPAKPDRLLFEYYQKLLYNKGIIKNTALTSVNRSGVTLLPAHLNIFNVIYDVVPTQSEEKEQETTIMYISFTSAASHFDKNTFSFTSAASHFDKNTFLSTIRADIQNASNFNLVKEYRKENEYVYTVYIKVESLPYLSILPNQYYEMVTKRIDALFAGSESEVRELGHEVIPDFGNDVKIIVTRKRKH